MKYSSKFIARVLGEPSHQRLPDLGEREMAVLEVLWQLQCAGAQSVQEALSGPPVSLSTVQSTLERLHRKNLLQRRKQGRAYIYQPKINRSELIAQLLRDMADDVAGGELTAMLSGFMHYVASEAPDIEREMSELIDKQAQVDGERDDG